ncbi:tetratricopeptide repeat protein [Lentisphaera profundi]|uniref:Tetratricopeptide repeat protein n=1 Tax=Lentisphaera profundi TaxID=1658616 RepID=A0ABY7VWE7_9BACT|nr:tetratricopeptide repeat protein [Lentisphaera profundi]WDE98104.1 tetratricopeptide repeat protein [Lentisphaera profundi]
MNKRILAFGLLFLSLSCFAQSFGVKDLKDSAAKGDEYSQLLLGLLYKNGQGLEPSFINAAEQFMMSASQGNGAACYELGQFYEEGYGYRQSYKKAAEWYRRGVIFGEQRCNYALAKLLVESRVKKFEDENPDKMFEKAWDYFEARAKKDEFENNYYLGKMSFSGWGTLRSPHKALSYFKLGADNYDGPCLYEYAKFYLKGMIVEASAKKGIGYLESAVENYSVGAMKMKLRLAQVGDKHLFLLPSREQQLLLEKNLADRGVSEFQFTYGMRLKKYNMREFRLTGVSYLEKSANQQWVPAEFELGQILIFGKYAVKQEINRGKMYLQSAADSGHPKAKRLLHELRKHSGDSKS